MLAATYMSADKVDRADAFAIGYQTVCQHPNEIGELEATDILVMDLNFVLFENSPLAIRIANEAAQRGVLVGVHSYHAELLDVQGLAKAPNLLMAKNHLRLLFQLGRHAKLHGRPWQKIVKAAKLLKGQVNHVRKHDQEAAVGCEADIPVGV